MAVPPRSDDRIEEHAMTSPGTERELHQPSGHRQVAAELRQLAVRLGRAGFHDQAARQLLEARLHDLQAAALDATS
jgi:hypothetical protein